MNKLLFSDKLAKNEKNIKKDIDILYRFINIFCDNNHTAECKTKMQAVGRLGYYLDDRETLLCDNCKKLLVYAACKLLLCPYDPKPRCKKCETHCYKAPYRQEIKGVMRYSGLYSLKHGRIDLIVAYLL